MKTLVALSRAVLTLEKGMVKVLLCTVFGLILLNIISRSLGVALFWVDEAAIYAMIWMVFVAASIGIHQQAHICVALPVRALSKPLDRVLKVSVNVIVFGFNVFFLGCCWIWFDLPALREHGFDLDAFAAASFNFIYQEPTNTLGLPKFLIWIILPVFALSASLHSLARLLTDLQPLHTQETP